MSVIGHIGQFLIDYQETIGTIVFIALVIVLVFLLVRMIVKNNRRKKAEIAERDRLFEELLRVSQDNQEILAALARVTAIDTKVEELAAKQGTLNEELIKQLEQAAGGTVDEIVTKAVQAARVADEASKKAAEVQAPQPAVEQPEVAPKPTEQHIAEPEIAPQPEPTPQPRPAEPKVAQPEYIAPQPNEAQPAPTVITEKAEPARAYESRDAGIDKHGNVYTESMLMEQIG